MTGQLVIDWSFSGFFVVVPTTLNLEKKIRKSSKKKNSGLNCMIFV